MLLTARKSPIMEKTEELCQTILEHPGFKDMRARSEAFRQNPEAQELYQGLLEKQEHLQSKQHQGIALTPEEIADFERDREELFANPVAKGFIDGQQQMQDVHSSINKYVAKTLELGRMPTEADMQSGGCACGGGGCGCSG